MADIPPIPPYISPDEIIRDKFDWQHLQIQIFLFGTFLIFTGTLILGRFRSRGNSYMQITSTTFFAITTSLTTFIFGLMGSRGPSNNLYVIWSAFIAYLAAVANQSSCYTLKDNEDRIKRLFANHFTFWPFIYALLIINKSPPEIIAPICFVFGVVIWKFRERIHALACATSSNHGMPRAAKIISYFNRYRKEGGRIGGYPNPSYNSLLVGVKEAKVLAAKQSNKGMFKLIEFDLSNVITLDNVLDRTNTFLEKTKGGNELRETCISFSMFWVLLAKVVGFDNVDVKLFKSEIQLGLDSFDLVEKELGFLYDYLFTNYYAIYERGLWRKLRDICIMFFFFIVTLPLLIEYHPDERNVVYVLLWGSVLDTGFTRFVILAIVTIELTQICIFLTSKWAKVMYTCAYLQNPTKRNVLLKWTIRFVHHVPRPRLSVSCFSTFTRRKLGQYSILKSYNAIPVLKWGECCIGSFVELHGIGHGGSSNEDLSPSLKISILNAINNIVEHNGGKVTNGVRFLGKNGLEDDIINPFVTEVSSQARVILIWHLVTSYMETKDYPQKPNKDTSENEETSKKDNDPDFLTSTILSKYSAYLIAFIPQIFSNTAYRTQCEFDEAIKELQETVTERVEDSEDPKGGLKGENSILEEARKLLGKLATKETRWKILADFWTETLLFTALADHGEAIDIHVNTLCIGGEFITHVWALATHAGCSRSITI